MVGVAVAGVQGFLGAALSSNVLSIHPDGDSGRWATSTVIKQPWTPVEGWALPEQPPLITGASAPCALLPPAAPPHAVPPDAPAVLHLPCTPYPTYSSDIAGSLHSWRWGLEGLSNLNISRHCFKVPSFQWE